MRALRSGHRLATVPMQLALAAAAICHPAVHAAAGADAVALDPATEELIEAHPAGRREWSRYGGSPGGGQYSGLDQITTGNVRHLERAWVYHTGEVSDGADGSHGTAFESQPIIAGERLLLCSPRGRVIALSPETGAELWVFDPRVDRAGSVLGAHLCRGVAYWSDPSAVRAAPCAHRVYSGSGDGRLFAVDADSGQLCADFGERGQIDLNRLENLGTGRIGITSPPAIIGDRVIVGAAFPSYARANAPDGIVRAFDARSGRLWWEWNAIPSPQHHRTGGANAWAPMAVDEERGLVIVATGSATPDPYGGNRTDPTPYANAIVALDAQSGRVRWHYQVVHHDLFDYDLPAQPLLTDLRLDGRTVAAAIQVTKMGFVFVLDRESGLPVFPVTERAVPQSDLPGERSAPTQPHPAHLPPFARQSLRPGDAWGLTPWDRSRCRERIEALRNEGLYTPPSLRGTVQIPGPPGAGNWGGAAYDPRRRLLIVNATNLAFASRLQPRAQFAAPTRHERYTEFGELIDTPFVWRSELIRSPLGIPCTPPPWGTLTAIDLAAGTLRWQIPFGRMAFGPLRTPRAWGAPNLGGPIVTAGGVVFIGASLDSRLRAYAVESGEELWSAELPAPAIATPMTYSSGHPPRQYVVVAAGGHVALGGPMSDAVVAYALPAGAERSPGRRVP
jgi:quinoprotein glucose dehydrogenase